MIDPHKLYAKKGLAGEIGMDAAPFILAYDEGRLEAVQVGRSIGFYGWSLIQVAKGLPKVSGPEMAAKHSRFKNTPQGAKG